MGSGDCIERTTFAQAARKSPSGFPVARNGVNTAIATTWPSWLIEKVTRSAEDAPSYSHPLGTAKEISPNDCTWPAAVTVKTRKLKRIATRDIEALALD